MTLQIDVLQLLVYVDDGFENTVGAVYTLRHRLPLLVHLLQTKHCKINVIVRGHTTVALHGVFTH